MSLSRRLPFPLSERIASASSAIYNRQGREVDVAIGGIPFRLATINDLPQSIETIKVRKDQFDAENDPGEQSLSGWWRRSQASFHEGAGNLYQESGETNAANNGFFDSEGVDVFTPGQLTLLRRMVDSANATGYRRVRTSVRDTTTTWLSFVTSDGRFGYLDSPTDTTFTTEVDATGSGHNVIDGVISNDHTYVISTEGNLWETPLASIGSFWTLGGNPTRLEWAKHRLWIIGGQNIWQPDLSIASGSAQTPVFTHPNKGWTYTCIAEGPAAVYFGGHDGNLSSIQAITLDSAGGVPTLTGAAVTAVLPQGELVQELKVLGGQYIGIGTNRGFRVGFLDANGTITYGPLLIEPEGVVGCTALATQGRFFLVAFDADVNDVYRVDTGTQVSEGIFAYSRSEVLGAVAVTSLAVHQNEVVGTDSTDSFYYQHPTEYVSSGWLQTGRVRFRTNEPKEFRYVHLEVEPLDGAIAFELELEGGSTLTLGSLTEQGATFDESFAVNSQPMRYASLKLTLTPDGTATMSPVINSYLLRALPAAAPQRLITLPLLCYDHEQSRSGQRYGGQTFAIDRLTALMTLEDAAQTLIYQDFHSNLSTQVVIESLRFVQTVPAKPYRAEGGGGIVVLELRTVDK